MTGETFTRRLGLQQRVVPNYRAVFFEALARRDQGGLNVFAGQPLAAEGIEAVDSLQSTQLVRAKNHYLFDPSSPWFMCWQDGFIDWLEQWQPDVLVVEANPRYPVTRSAIRWMHARSRKVIGWGLGAPPISGLFSGLRQKERFSLVNSLDSVIAYSRLGAEQYRQMGVAPEKVYVASNAVAPVPTTPPPDRPSAFNGSPCILFVGRLQKRKRVDLLIQACAALPGTLKPKLLIVGDGPASDGLRQLAEAEYPATEFTGARHGAELEPYFTQADLFVLPGTGGLAIQQAMAHGLPVVVARGDGTQDDLVRPENGWRIPTDDVSALAQTLHAALSDVHRLRQMGKASYRLVSEEVNLERMVGIFIQALSSVHR
jgi:glycosyltransferase involved in cell wall biosynthesis